MKTDSEDSELMNIAEKSPDKHKKKENSSIKKECQLNKEENKTEEK